MAERKYYPANGLEINFLGLPMVVSDGQTENTLTLALTNNNFSGRTSGDQDRSITFTPNTPIYVWFVVDDQQASAVAERMWALTSYDAFHAGNVKLTPGSGNWDVERSDDLTGNPLNDSMHGWKLTAKETLSLTPGQSLVLTLSGLTTNLPNGHTSCYCQVDLPVLDAYGEEAESLLKVIGPITKSRLMIVGDKVGIGMANPSAALDVNGTVRARGDVKTDGDVQAGGDITTTGDATITGGDLTVESSHKGGLGPRLRLINTGGTKGAAAAIEFSGYDTRGDGDTPAFRINCEDDGHASADLVFSTKGPGVSATLTERLRVTSDGRITTTGAAAIGGNITSQGRIEDKFGAVMPVGAIIAYGGSTPPPGWLLCDGQEVEQAQHPELYAALGGDMAGVMQFNGSNYLDVAPLHTDYLGHFAISMHIFPETLNDWQVLCQFSDDESLSHYLVLQIYQSKLRVAINNVTGGGQTGELVVLANTPLKAQQWNHLVVSLIQGGLSVYLDGSNQDFAQATLNNVPVNARFTYGLGPKCNFGRIAWGSKDAGGRFVGKIKNLRFPPPPLTDADITKLSQSSPTCTTPDLRGRFIVGVGQGPGRFSYVNNASGGEETHTLTESEMPSHTHSINKGDFGIHSQSFQGEDDKDLPFETHASTPLGGTDSTGGNQPHNNLPPFYALTYIIKC